MTPASTTPHSLVVVTPVYEDAQVAARLFRELAAALGSGAGGPYIVAVDDGSVREPVDAAAIGAAGLEGVVLKLRRNVGHQRAIAIGLSYVAKHLPETARIVVMDSDGEDVPLSVRDLNAALDRPDVDVVVARRRSRVETLRFRTFYVIYKWMFKTLAGREMNFGNFLAFKSHALHRLVSMQELWIHVAACVLTSRLRIATCPLDRGPRYGGQSKMNFVGLALHGFKGLMVFAEDVLVRVGIACSIVATLAVAGSIAAIVLKLLGFATPGWFSVALGILLLVFLQTGALTLVMLMLTGVVKVGALVTIRHEDFIESVTSARGGQGS